MRTHPFLTGPAAAAACVPGQLIGNSGFESGTTACSASSGVIGAFSGQTAHGGTRFAWLDGYGRSYTDTLNRRAVDQPADPGQRSPGRPAHLLEVACTALKITLTTPLAQGQSGTVGFNVSIAVPNGSDRFGRDGAYNFIGNAIPVLAVRAPRGLTGRRAVSASTAFSMRSTELSAMDGHGSRFGTYPYGEVDLVLHNNFWFGGMEYPGWCSPSRRPPVVLRHRR